MKKHIQSLTYIVIIGLLMGGCTLQDGEKMKTKTGQEMFFFWNQRTEILFSGFLERAFNFNAWLTAPEAEKQEVLNRYFDTDESVCTFHEIAQNIWEFQYNDGEKRLRFELSGGNSLDDPDAVLTVRLSYPNGSNNPFVNCDIIIQNMSAGVWKIQTNGGENVVVGTLHVGDAAPASLANQNVAFEAEGLFTFFDNTNSGEVPVYMLYTINSPMVYTFRERFAGWWHESSTTPCTLKAGKVTLTAIDRHGTEGNTAVITVTGDNAFDVEIGGVTQPWHL